MSRRAPVAGLNVEGSTQNSCADAADPAVLTPAVPVVLLHGRDDEIVPLGISESYLRRQGARGHPEVTLRPIEACGHFGLIDPEHPGFDEALAAVSQLDS